MLPENGARNDSCVQVNDHGRRPHDMSKQRPRYSKGIGRHQKRDRPSHASTSSGGSREAPRPLETVEDRQRAAQAPITRPQRVAPRTSPHTHDELTRALARIGESLKRFPQWRVESKLGEKLSNKDLEDIATAMLEVADGDVEASQRDADVADWASKLETRRAQLDAQDS